MNESPINCQRHTSYPTLLQIVQDGTQLILGGRKLSLDSDLLYSEQYGSITAGNRITVQHLDYATRDGSQAIE